MQPRRTWLVLSAKLSVLLSVGVGTAQAAEPARSETPEPRATWLIPSLHALGLMTTMRVSEAYLWPEPFAETNHFVLASHYQQAYSRPPRWDSRLALFQEDGDRWQINVIGHGLFGSELYVRARACHKPAWQALLFTGLASTTWEYGFEASGVRPSALDLVFTPAAGLLLGEARFFTWSRVRRLSPGVGRSILSALVDPLGDLERGLGAPC